MLSGKEEKIKKYWQEQRREGKGSYLLPGLLDMPLLVILLLC
jgi:hypothetical protein